MQHGMNQMLHGVEHSRLARARDRQQALDPQNLITVTVEKHREPDSEDLPVDGRIDLHTERLNGPGAA